MSRAAQFQYFNFGKILKTDDSVENVANLVNYTHKKSLVKTFSQTQCTIWKFCVYHRVHMQPRASEEGRGGLDLP